MERDKREAQRLYVSHGVDTTRIAKRLKYSPPTIRRWCAEGKWRDRRTEAEKGRQKQQIRALRSELKDALPEKVRRNLNFTGTLKSRAYAVLVNSGKVCDKCGRGEDTDKGLFKPTVGDLVSLMRFEMQLLGADEHVGFDDPLEEFPELPAEFVAEAAVLFARYEGTMPAVQLLSDGKVQEASQASAE